MAGISLAQAEAKLTAYLAAEEAAAAGKSYTIGDRTYTRQDLDDLRAGIDYWQNKATTLSQQVSGRSRSRTMVPGG